MSDGSITLGSLHTDLVAIRHDLVRLEAKIDGKPSLMAMVTAVFIVVFGMFGIAASTIATLNAL
jgi:hypothetical protein